MHVYVIFSRTTSYCLIQLGFRKNHSYQTALITLTDEIYNATQTGLLQLDLSKAFDLGNQTLLLEKLKLYHCNDCNDGTMLYADTLPYQHQVKLLWTSKIKSPILENQHLVGALKLHDSQPPKV